MNSVFVKYNGVSFLSIKFSLLDETIEQRYVIIISLFQEMCHWTAITCFCMPVKLLFNTIKFAILFDFVSFP